MRKVFGQEILNFLFIDSKTNCDMTDAKEMSLHFIKADAPAEVRRIYIDIIDGAQTSEVKLGAAKAYCWIYGCPNIDAAREAVKEELAA